ncbi:MAG: hypothetical protein H6R26_2099 [Proteobacteria bacterium]|nr:hypothetical protein [Pseudomonadota bacterium]
MSNALRDQLLKAGLVSDKQVKKAVKEKRQEANQRPGKGQANPAVDTRAQAQRTQAEKAERDRQLNLQRQVAAEQKAIAAQIRQMVDSHRIAAAEGDIPFNFADGKTVKRLYVTPPLRDKISRGQLAIVKVEGRYELVSAEAAEKIRARHAPSVILWNEPKPAEEPKAGDDPYAGYEVPDDLMW